MSTYPHRPKAEAFSNAVDVVERLRDPTDPAKCRGRVPSARRCGDGDGDVIHAGLRLSTKTL